MGILIDLILIIIVLLNIIIGYKRGLINVVFNICAFVIAIILTLILYKPISNIIINTTNIDNKIKEIIIDNNQPSESSESSENTETQKNTTNLQKYIETKIQNTTTEAKEQATEVVAETIAKKGVDILSAIILFIIIRTILIVLKFLIEGIANLPIIKQFNETGGIIYGILKSIIIIYLLLTIAFIIISINGNGQIAEIINSSYITKILYNNNIIVNYCFFGKNLL